MQISLPHGLTLDYLDLMHYADLSPYCHFTNSPHLLGKIAVNVGWLDNKHRFPTGSVPTEFLPRLTKFYRRRVHQTRGFHPCEFCDASSPFPTVAVDGREIGLGTSEIIVPGREDVCYVAPDLLFHYVVAHAYLPPKEFVDAVTSELIEPPAQNDAH